MNNTESNLIFQYNFIKNQKNFNNLWKMKSNTRECIKEWLSSTNINNIIVETSSNACSELIENCIKYSIDNKLCRLQISIINNSIIIETINSAEVVNKTKILETLNLIDNNKNNLTKIYIDKLRLSAKYEKSELGFIKIMMETNGKIVVQNKDNNEEVHLILEISY